MSVCLYVSVSVCVCVLLVSSWECGSGCVLPMLRCSRVMYDVCMHESRLIIVSTSLPEADVTPCRLLEVQDFLEADEVEEYTKRSTSLGLETMELQWKSYVNNLKESGTLSNALAVCDVSGSMSGQPMEVSPVMLISPYASCCILLLLHPVVVASCCCCILLLHKHRKAYGYRRNT